MRVSVNWLRELVALPENTTTAQIAATLTRAGLQVEHIEQLGELSGPIVVGRILDFVAEPQKNGKTIRWCQVDVGEATARGIVCGATNFKVGDFVVVSLPGALLAGGVEIAARKTYGHISDGMICAADELGLGTDHSGIIILPDPIGEPTPTPGADALALMHARDEVLEIDVTPDIGCYALSMRGVAREVAQGFGVEFKDPYATVLPDPVSDGYPVRLETPACDIFVALNVDGIDPSAPSPTWMTSRLAAAGMRAISLAVDVTNYVMLESGQPLHAYDADKLLGPIVVRQAQAGEHMVTLDDVDRKLHVEDMMITDDSGPIGIAGVMGGQATEVSGTTTNIVLEAAHFDPVLIGRTFRRHKLASEASIRFARGVDAAVQYAAARRAGQLLVDLGGGQLREQLTVVGTTPAMPIQTIPASLPARILGIPVDAEQVATILTASGVVVETDADELTLTPPTWRVDLVDPYDYVEEVGRKIGFDVLTPRVPRATAGRGLTKAQRARRAIIAATAQAGFVEVLTLPFIGDDELNKLGLDKLDPRRDVVRLANPLSDTQPYLRTTLLPGLFAAVARNTSRNQDDLTLFESGLVFLAGERASAPMPEVARRPDDGQIAELFEAVARQPRLLATVLTGQWRPASWWGPGEPADWRHAFALVDTIAATVGLRVECSSADRPPWHPGRCAQLSVDGHVIGYAGELHPKVISAFGLPARACGLEIDLDVLIDAAPDGGEVAALSPFPLVKEDVALIVGQDVPVAAVQAALVAGCGPLLETISLFDVYTGDQIEPGSKSLAFALGFRAPDKTLTEAEAIAAKDAGVKLAAQRCGAVQRG